MDSIIYESNYKRIQETRFIYPGFLQFNDQINGGGHEFRSFRYSKQKERQINCLFLSRFKHLNYKTLQLKKVQKK